MTPQISHGNSRPWCTDGAARVSSTHTRSNASPSPCAIRLPHESWRNGTVRSRCRRQWRKIMPREVARRQVGTHLSTFGEAFSSIGLQLGVRYDGSPIIVPDGAPPPDNFTRYSPSSAPGGRAPHIWLDARRGRGNSLYDRLGIGFTLLRLGGHTAGSAT